MYMYNDIWNNKKKQTNQFCISNVIVQKNAKQKQQQK